MTNKTISQLVSADGAPAAPATSATGCFIHDGADIAHHKNIVWGDAFSDPRAGNHVDFYVTGAHYFEELMKAIAGAKKSIYIAGWQVNFDVELVPGKTLYQCLEKAIDANDNLHIYIMPWLSPKVGVDTGDFETMLAVFQLNAGLKSKTKLRAFALPAIAQSDMKAGLGIGFSHHQKLVVIDDKRAFTGGIDVAYGRRDDGRYLLSHEKRTGNELYNTCVPAIEEISSVESGEYLTRLELLAACFTGKTAAVGTFAMSAPAAPIAYMQDGMKAVSEYRKKATAYISDYWATQNLMPEFIDKALDIPIDKLQDEARFAYDRLDKHFKGKLERLRTSGSAHAANAATVLLAWLNNVSMDQLPAGARAGAIVLIETFMIDVMSRLALTAGTRPKRYENLKKLGKIIPKSGKVLHKDQPRMPWHDVQCSITGPSVSDLSRNFSLRWNGIADRYRRSHKKTTTSKEVQMLFHVLGLSPATSALWIPAVPPPPAYEQQPKTGKCWVQVLRSAPATLLRDELGTKGSKTALKAPQNNCLKAMLTAIYAAQKFIYIEGQFFQSEYGVDSATGTQESGPLAALIDISAHPLYEKYARQLGIYGVPPAEIPAKIRWSQLDNVSKDLHGKDRDFKNDLKAVLSNIAAIEASNVMGKAQKRLLNPIGEALARRIEQAIFDDEPFHVYMVLPAHPEGTLNTLNIMTQLHLTMESLNAGRDSLLHRIRRAIVTADLIKDKGITPEEARTKVRGLTAEQVVVAVGTRWSQYLTLLNLRNWENIGKRPVTEQIYVHSKLLVVDDRVAILGSANINDRSQLGDRDSELAVVVRDDHQVNVKIDGVHTYPVSASVHDLRKRLWEKIFGLAGGSAPARDLEKVIDHPAAPATWRAIQRVANQNAKAYSAAFAHLPKHGKPSSIWPVWDANAKTLLSYMPFNEQFWRDPDILDVNHTYDAKKRGHEAAPVGVTGFFVALPWMWTAGENNISGMNLTLLANLQSDDGARYASNDNSSVNGTPAAGVPAEPVRATT